MYITYRVGGVALLNSLALEQETHGLDVLALSFAKGSHQLLKLSGTLDLEEHFVVVVRDLDVQVLATGRGVLSLSRRAAALVLAGHLG